MGLKVGDTVYRDPENEMIGKCRRCQRHDLVITLVPPSPAVAGPEGFWKIPTE